MSEKRPRFQYPRMHCHGAASSLTPYVHGPELVANLRKTALGMTQCGYAGASTVVDIANVIERVGEQTMKAEAADQSLRAEATRTFERMWEVNNDPAA